MSSKEVKPGATARGFVLACLRRLAVFAFVALFLGRATVTLAQSLSSEVEPNDSPPTATPITLANGFAIVSGSIDPEGDEDYFSFVASAGARAWIYVDTGGTPDINADSLDSIVTLFEGNGFTAIEEDDDDGSGNGCDSTTESFNSSAIGGRVLTAGGTYYIRVREYSDQGVINPYHLYLVVTTTAPAAEAESNGTPATANPLAPPIAIRTGVINPASDQDYYSVMASAGSTLYINADGDPERDGLGTDLVIDLYATNGTTLLYSANSSTAGSATDPPAEAFCYTVPVAGTYYVRVTATNMSTGAYQLMVAGATGSTLQFNSSLYAVRENSGTATVTVVRSGVLAGTVTVQFTTSNGTAVAGSDYTAVTRTLTFTNGVTNQFVSIPITNDVLPEANETVMLRLSSPSGSAVLGTTSSATLVILDNDEPPNNTPATATPLDLSTGFAMVTNVTGSIAPAISPPGDEDWYSFTAPPGAKMWAYVDTGGTQSPAATSRDSRLALYGSDGTTLIEEDDDDGSGNDCGPTLDQEGKLASAIAGRVLTSGGTYYLRVTAFDTNAIIDPYKLFVVLTTTAPVPEAEPNDTPGFANALVTAASPIVERSAQIGMANDVDIYSLVAPSNSLFYISADADPERDGTSTDVVLELLGTDGTTVLFVADSSSDEPAAAEAFCFRLTQAGRYFVRVRHFSETGRGTYALMAARVPVEAEPNDDPATAAPLDLLNGFVRTTGAIAPANDKDYYSFVSPPGAKIWLTVDTGGPQQPGATSRNSVLTLFGADGVTAIEQDDNDGSGNGCDGTLESGDASAIAGRTLVAGGNYYIRVSASGGSAVINPYTLFAMLTTTAPVPEAEGNDSSGSANTIVAVGSAVGVRSGSIGTPGDVDFYSVAAVAGNTLHISADADPERDGFGTDLRVDLLSTDGSTVLFSANSSANGTMSDPAAEAFCYVVPTAGTYFVRVQHASTGTGTYQLMVSRDKVEPPISEVRIIALETIGADVKLSFPSQVGKLYRIERTDTLTVTRPIPWNALPGVVAGTGGVVSYVDTGAAGQSQKFYRVRQEP